MEVCVHGESWREKKITDDGQVSKREVLFSRLVAELLLLEDQCHQMK